MMTTQLSERYEILSELGRGSFGTVYLARDRNLGRDVALKILHPALVMHPDTVRLFSQEAGVLAQLEHDNIVTVYDMGVSDDSRFIAMRMVQGRSLAQVLQDDGPQSPERVAQWFAQIAAGLDYAHAREILHRDLKPSNLLLDEARDRILISDFGLARAVESSGGSSSDHQRHAQPGTVLYMAPEVVNGDKATQASDLYGLGCVLFELLSGVPPFTGDTPMSVMFQHVQAQAPPLDVVGETGQALARQVAALLAKDPAQRPASAQASVAALRDQMMGRIVPTTEAPIAPPAVTTPQKAGEVPTEVPPVGSVVPPDAPPDSQTPTPPVRTSRRRPLLAGAVLAALLLIAAFAIAYLGPGRATPSAPQIAVPAETESVIPRGVGNGTPTPPIAQVVAAAGTTDYAVTEDDGEVEAAALLTVTVAVDTATTDLNATEMTATAVADAQATVALQATTDAAATDAAATTTAVANKVATEAAAADTATASAAGTRSAQATVDAQATSASAQATAAIVAAATSSAATAIAQATSVAQAAAVQATTDAQATADAQATVTSAQVTAEAQAAAARAAVTLEAQATADAQATANADATAQANATAHASAQETASAQAIATSVAATTEARQAARDATATAAALATAASVDATATADAGIARSTATAVARATEVSAATTRVAAAVATRISATETAEALNAALTADARNAAATASAATAVAESRRATAVALVATMTADANAVATTQAAATRAAVSARSTSTAEAQRMAAATATAAAAKTAAARTPPTPTRTRTPTPTRTRSPQPPTPTQTPTPRSVASNAPAGMANWGISPVFPDEQAASETDQRYEWTANFTLPEGYAFEPVFWRRDEDPMAHGSGWGGTTRDTSLIVKWSKLTDKAAPDV